MTLIENPNCYCYYIVRHLPEWELLIISPVELYELVEKTIKPAKDFRKKKIFLNNLKSQPNVGAMLEYMRNSCKAASRLESK